ncbi:MAG: fumarate reductase subunit C [Acidobacteriia bacterium]|nr:fumarate reductase subunit C [Terriglobia bacterium]
MCAVKQPTTRTAPAYTEFHPRWYRPQVSVYWWLFQRQYLKFILRELSSVFVAAFVVITLLQLNALRNGPEAYARFQQWLQTPAAIALNVVSFCFVVFHAITWFNLAPSAMAVRLRGKPLPDFMVAAPNYAVWLVVSGAVAWLVLR